MVIRSKYGVNTIIGRTAKKVEANAYEAKK